MENGSGFLGALFVKLDQSKRRMPWYYKEDPAELFRRNDRANELLKQLPYKLRHHRWHFAFTAPTWHNTPVW